MFSERSCLIIGFFAVLKQAFRFLVLGKLFFRFPLLCLFLCSCFSLFFLTFCVSATPLSRFFAFLKIVGFFLDLCFSVSLFFPLFCASLLTKAATGHSSSRNEKNQKRKTLSVFKWCQSFPISRNLCFSQPRSVKRQPAGLT